MKNIVVLGGGTGSFTVLTGLKKYPNVNLTALVTSFDSGGSSGRLRDEFGYLPVGDFRQALTALGSGNGDTLFRRLFNYRFDSGGSGLTGHNLGNLILTALTDLLGSEAEAIRKIGSVFEINGAVIPITLARKIDLMAQYQNGKIVKGEARIDEPRSDHDQTSPISRIWLEPPAAINREAKKAIEQADLLVFGPGDFYTSVMPNALVSGFRSALNRSKAKSVFIINLINKIGQTYGMTASDYLNRFKDYTGSFPDFVILNSARLPKNLLSKYASEGSFPITDDLDKKASHILRTNLLAQTAVKSIKGDTIKRSLIRHNPEKLAAVIIKILHE